MKVLKVFCLNVVCQEIQIAELCIHFLGYYLLPMNQRPEWKIQTFTLNVSLHQIQTQTHTAIKPWNGSI